MCEREREIGRETERERERHKKGNLRVFLCFMNSFKALNVSSIENPNKESLQNVI
jgi:hypothetical protein